MSTDSEVMKALWWRLTNLPCLTMAAPLDLMSHTRAIKAGWGMCLLRWKGDEYTVCVCVCGCVSGWMSVAICRLLVNFKKSNHTTPHVYFYIDRQCRRILCHFSDFHHYNVILGNWTQLWHSHIVKKIQIKCSCRWNLTVSAQYCRTMMPLNGSYKETPADMDVCCFHWKINAGPAV